MATTTEPKFWRTSRRDNGAYVDGYSANEIVSSNYKPVSLAKGTWVEFPDGSRFRRATNYERANLQRYSGNSERTDFDASTLNKWRCITSPGGCTNGNFTSGNWIYRLGADYGVPNVLRGPSFQTMENNEATTKALNDLANQKAQVGENLATLGQTIRMFANPVSGLVKALKTMRADKSMAPYLTRSFMDLYKSNKIDKMIANRYLEYVYGFKPLMQDIHSLSEFAKEQGKKPLLLNARSSARRDFTGADLRYDNVSQRRREDAFAIQANSRSTCSLWAQIDPNYSGTRTMNQLGLLNPASLVWELVPYSFVVDWVLPIGPVLQALTAPAGLIFVDGSRSRRVSAGWTTTDFRYRASESILTSTPADNRWEYEGYVRERISTWPRPGIWIDYDPFRLSRGGSDRIFKALALSIAGLKAGRL